MINNLMQFIRDPMQALVRTKFNIPKNIQVNNANDVIQYLLDSGQLTQDQYNQANQRARQIQEDSQFKQMFGIK